MAQEGGFLSLTLPPAPPAGPAKGTGTGKGTGAGGRKSDVAKTVDVVLVW